MSLPQMTVDASSPSFFPDFIADGLPRMGRMRWSLHDPPRPDHPEFLQ